MRLRFKDEPIHCLILSLSLNGGQWLADCSRFLGFVVCGFNLLSDSERMRLSFMPKKISTDVKILINFLLNNIIVVVVVVVAVLAGAGRPAFILVKIEHFERD